MTAVEWPCLDNRRLAVHPPLLGDPCAPLYFRVRWWKYSDYDLMTAATTHNIRHYSASGIKPGVLHWMDARARKLS